MPAKYATVTESAVSPEESDPANNADQRMKTILLGNQRTFSRESPYLDALLVYAGLFSAVLAAFLIETRKDLEEDVLDKILLELRQSDEPFEASSLSIWVNGLWFASLSLSLASALFVILAKAMGRRVLDREEIEAMFKSRRPDGATEGDGQGSEGYKFQLTKSDKAFKKKFAFLTMSATLTISASLTLFYPGLVVLIYTSQRGIAWSVAAIAALMGAVSFVCVLHDVYSASRYDTE